jgi:DNA replicative helicase MCM subunit Mcm2 (Cdc46/Mcm family)
MEVADLYKDVGSVEQTTPDGRKVKAYAADYLKFLWRIGFKIIPTFADGLGFNTKDLFTEEDYSKFPECENKPIRLISLDPDIWTNERIDNESWRFEGIRTLPGKTYVRDINGNIISGPYMLCIVDIDSEGAYRKCQKELQNDWINVTYVTKSLKEFGFHIYWFEDWTEDNDFITIDDNDLKSQDSLFEIGIGLKYTQLAGCHRKDSSFRYKNIGCLKLRAPEIMIRNGLYNTLLDSIFKDLLLDVNDIKSRRKMQHKNMNPFHKQFNSSGGTSDNEYANLQNITFRKLSDWQIEMISLWACNFYGANDHYYFFMRSFLGTLVWYRIDEESAIKIIDRICGQKPSSEPKSKWYDLLSSSYQTLINGGNVEGRPRLIKAIQRNLNFIDMNYAIKQVEDLISCIKSTGGYDSTRQTYQTEQEENEPDHIISVSEATSLHGGNNKVEGVISGIWPKQKLIEKISYRCLNCNSLNEVIVKGRLSNGKPTIFQVIKTPKRCANCEREQLVEDKTHTSYANAIQIELRNPDTYSEIDPLKVVVFDEDAEEIVHHVGEKVIVTGLINNELVFNKWKRFTYLYAKSIRYESKEKLELKDSDIEKIRSLVREWGNDIITHLAEKYFAPNIIGYNDVKKGLLLCAASTNLDTNRKKLNAALLGDPGTAKSLLLQEAIKLVANSTIVSAQSSSGISLTAIVETEKDSHVLRLGPIPLSRGGICALNEGGGMNFGHQKYLLDVMQEQKFKFSKHGITALVSSPTSIIWSSNPTSGKWKNPESIDLDEFPAIKPLIDRFDLIYAIRDNRDAEEERIYADIKFEMDDNSTNETLENESNLVYLQKHIEYSKKFRPEFSDEAKFMLKEYYLAVRAKYGSRRVRESIVTIARMIAQLKLKDVIDAEDAKETQEVFNRVLEPLQKIVNTTTNPIDVIVEECLNILKESNNIEWKFYTNLIERACENPQAQKYIDNAHKKRNNDKLRPILDRLLNHTHVKLTKRNPLTLAWMPDSEITPGDCNSFGKREDIEVDGSSISIKEFGEESKHLRDNDSASPISTFRHFDISTSRSPLNYFFVNNFKNDQNAILRCRNVEITINTRTTTTTTAAVAQLLPPISTNIPGFNKFAAFDCEWYREDLKSNIEKGRAGKIYCFCLVDSQGVTRTLHIDQFGGNETKFLLSILEAIKPYDVLIGYAILAKKNQYKKGSIDGDVEILRGNFEHIGYSLKFEECKNKIKFLDLHGIFSCNSTKAFLASAENVIYRTDTLHDVATAYLKEGKLESIKGTEAEFLEPEKQMGYCLQDAALCLKLAEKDNFRLLQIFYNISKEISPYQDFFDTCNYAKSTSWWRNKLKLLNYQKVGGEDAKWQNDHIIKDENGRPKKGVPYTGGKVFDPIPGLHKNVITYDVGSMYPTMSHVHNISSETINCNCCKEDPAAKIPDEIMKMINDDLIAEGYEPIPWQYWICQRRRGVLSQVMGDLYQKKNEYKKRGLTLEEKAVKLFANSGYGVFGQVHFEFYDFRVVELITAFARHTLLGLKDLLHTNNVEILYGDTDSLFVNGGAISDVDIVSMAKEKFQVDFAQDRVWKILALMKNKKQYFGILKNGKAMHKTLVGLKNNYPSYFNEVVEQLISKETIQLFLDGDDVITDPNTKRHILDLIYSSFEIMNDKLLKRDMDFIKNKLSYSGKTQKALYEHDRNCWQNYIFEEMVEDCDGDRELAKINNHPKSVYSFWKITPIGHNGDKKSCTIHPDRYILADRSYRRDLWNCLEPILEVYGFDKEELLKLKKTLVEIH